MKALLSLFGLGQSDLENVFKQTIEAAQKIDSQLSKAHRDGFALAISSMLDVLKHEDVATDATYVKLLEMLKKWHATKR